jgi:hypothetical protein
MNIVSCGVAALFCFSINYSSPSSSLLPVNYGDTTHISHVLDGSVNEWPANRFQPDEDTTIFMALDNDDKNFYVALTIPDYSMQTKLMRNGMSLYIDLKGKKREGRGIEFPIKGEVNNFISSSDPSPAKPPANGEEPKKEFPQKEIDKKTMRSIMSLGLTACKVFGMEGGGNNEQGIKMPGGVNIQFKWDADDVMHIEYLVPLRLLGENAALDKKEIFVGWKVNGFDRSQLGDRPGMNTRGNPEGFQHERNNPGAVGFNNVGRRPERPRSMAELMREQHFWTKFVFATVVKGF